MLSAEQQKIIASEDSIKLVNSVLRKLGRRGDEDLRQSALCYLCECIKRFDPNKKTKWTTYAYKNIFMFLKRNSQKPNMTIDFTSFADNTSDYIVARPIYSQVTLGTLRGLLKDCTVEEQQIVFLKYKGYKTYEIGEIRHQSPRYIARKLKEIRVKIAEKQLTIS